jgi:hypothetical protein
MYDHEEGMTFGVKGWYWEMSNGRMGVVVACHKLLNKYFKLDSDYKYPPFSEDIFYMSNEEFIRRKIHKMLKVPPTIAERRKLEIWHNKRHELPKNDLVDTGNHS